MWNSYLQHGVCDTCFMGLLVTFYERFTQFKLSECRVRWSCNYKLSIKLFGAKLGTWQKSRQKIVFLRFYFFLKEIICMFEYLLVIHCLLLWRFWEEEEGYLVSKASWPRTWYIRWNLCTWTGGTWTTQYLCYIKQALSFSNIYQYFIWA